jgi:hypothetical protein
MKMSLIMLLLFASSCSKPKHKFDDDYVLIEFAAKLEGNYHGPKDKHHSTKPIEHINNGEDK